MIVLANESDIVVYPEEYRGEIGSGKWHDLDTFVSVDLPERRPDNADETEQRPFSVTVTQTGTSVLMPFNIPAHVEAYGALNLSLLIPEQYRHSPDYFSIRTVTAIMRDGENEYKIVLRSKEAEERGFDMHFESDEPAVLNIPCVTGNIEINIDIIEWCEVIFECTDINAGAGRLYYHMPRNGGMLILGAQSYEMWLPKGYRVTSAIATTASGVELGDIYNARYDQIRYETSGLLEDMTVLVTIEPRTYNVNFTLKNSAGETIYQPEEPLKATYSEAHEGYVLVIDLKTIAGAENVTEILNNIYELEKKLDKFKPVFTYDPDNKTITVTNIQCNFKWICQVQ